MGCEWSSVAEYSCSMSHTMSFIPRTTKGKLSQTSWLQIKATGKHPQIHILKEEKIECVFLSSMTQYLKDYYLVTFKDLHLLGWWSHWGLGCWSGSTLCLSGQQMGWLWQREELSYQDKMSPMGGLKAQPWASRNQMTIILYPETGRTA